MWATFQTHDSAEGGEWRGGGANLSFQQSVSPFTSCSVPPRMPASLAPNPESPASAAPSPTSLSAASPCEVGRAAPPSGTGILAQRLIRPRGRQYFDSADYALATTWGGSGCALPSAAAVAAATGPAMAAPLEPYWRGPAIGLGAPRDKKGVSWGLEPARAVGFVPTCRHDAGDADVHTARHPPLC